MKLFQTIFIQIFPLRSYICSFILPHGWGLVFPVRRCTEQTANITYMCINIHKYMYNVQIQYTHMHADKCYLYIKYIVESHVLIEKKIVVRI